MFMESGVFMGKLKRPKIVLGAGKFNLYLVRVLQVRLYGDYVTFRAFAIFHIVQGQLITHPHLGARGQHSSANHYKLGSGLFAPSKLISNLNRERNGNSHLPFASPGGSGGGISRRSAWRCAGPSERVGTIERVAELKILMLRHVVLPSTGF
jgi:hypothetical protein